MRDVLRTALCDLLGIEYPIIQSGMANVAGPDLVAEVSRAGGLGILAGLGVPPDELRVRIRHVRERTDRPFGVNLWLHTELRPPPDPASISDERLAAVQGVLNGFRAELGLPAQSGRPPAIPDLIPAQIEMLLEERPAVFSVGLGDPGSEVVDRCHERGIKVIAMVATVEDARTVAASGVDVVIAQGSEAGGHRSTWVKRPYSDLASVGTLALVPQIVDAVSVPVVAAGGIADGRGLVAALALGAVGILLGTRFVATRDSMAPEFWKKSLLEQEGENTTLTDAFSGLWLRALRNGYTEGYRGSGAPVLPPLLQTRAAQDVVEEARRRGDGDYFPLLAGQGVGLVHTLPGAAEVVDAIVREARVVLAALPRRARTA
jgi:nitronate monooxygenase